MMTDENETDKKGRLKIYVVGVYPDISIKDPRDLPWAYPEHGSMIGGKFQQGWTSMPEIMSAVTVRFDCGNINYPIYTGTIPGTQHKIRNGDPGTSEPMHGVMDDPRMFDKPDRHASDIHRYADASTAKIDYTTKLQKDFKPADDTPAAFGGEDRHSISWAKQHAHVGYPRNHIFSTGKHTLEFDNTDGYERVAIGHMNGSSFSMDWSGDQIADARGHIWNTSRKSTVSTAGMNKVDVAKQHAVAIAMGDSITTVGGRTEMYFGKTVAPADLDMDYDADEIVSKVQVRPAIGSGGGGNTGSGGSDKGTYMEFSGDVEFKMVQAFTHEVDKDFSLKVKGSSNTQVDGSMLMQCNGAEMNMSTTGVMSMNATVIKLNCSPGAAAAPAQMKGGGAGGSGGTGAMDVQGKQPSATIDDQSTERDTALLASIIAQVDSVVISKYDSRSTGECDKI